jgi:hypothetical protein
MPKLIKAIERWYEVPDEHAPGRVLITHLKDGEINRIMADATDFWAAEGPTYRDGKAADMILVAAVKDWESFSDEDGKDMPCSDANKRRYGKEQWFRDFIRQKRRELADEANPKLEEQEKN